MAEKIENEITVKVTCSESELIKYLINKGFKPGNTFSLDDYYYLPSSLDIQNMTERDFIKSNYFKIY